MRRRDPDGIERVDAIATPELEHARWNIRPDKYQWVEHAERNAIYNAARHGIALRGARAYVNWSPVPCADCARAFIQAGIAKIIGPDIPFPGVGAGKHYSFGDIARTMLEEAGVTIRVVTWRKEEVAAHS